MVEAARRQAETSGATSGNRVAEYLRGAGEQPSHQAGSVLERLSRPTTPGAEAEVPAAQPTAPTEGVLESLVRPQAPTPSPTPPTPASAPEAPADKPVDLAKANDALSGLLGGKGGKK